VVKCNSNGIFQWSAKLGGAGDDGAYSVVKSADGGYALGGYTNSYGAGDYDIWLIEIDANGSMLWNRTYGGVRSDIGFSFGGTIEGGYAFVAFQNISYARGATILARTDPGGRMLWNKTLSYDESATLFGYSIIETKNQGFAVLATRNGGGAVSLFVTESEAGLAWTSSTANTVTLYRGETDPYWNYVRARIWKIG
jgi:hypothetical protein